MRVVVGDATTVFTRETDRTGESSWTELMPGDEFLAWTDEEDNDESCYANASLIIGCALCKLADFTVEYATPKTSGEATVIDLGTL